MRVEPISGVSMAYSVNYVSGIGSAKRIAKMDAVNEQNQKRRKKETQQKIAKKMNTMAREMQDITAYYDVNGMGNEYDFTSFEEFF